MLSIRLPAKGSVHEGNNAINIFLCPRAKQQIDFATTNDQSLPNRPQYF